MPSRDLGAEVFRKMFLVLSFKSPNETLPALVSKYQPKPQARLWYFYGMGILDETHTHTRRVHVDKGDGEHKFVIER